MLPSLPGSMSDSLPHALLQQFAGPLPNNPQQFDFQRALAALPIPMTAANNSQTFNHTAIVINSPPPPPAPAVPRTPPRSSADVLLARYAQHTSTANSPRTPSGAPKRTVLSVHAGAYLHDDPTLVDDFDPLQPTRTSKGLPKNAAEFWKWMEPYFALPSGKDLDYLARFAWPEGEEVEKDWDEQQQELTKEKGPSSALPGGAVDPLASMSASSAARAARRGPGRPSAAESNAHTQKLLEGLKSVELVREYKLRLEELLVQARLTVAAPQSPKRKANGDDSVDPASQMDTTIDNPSSDPALATAVPSGPISSDLAATLQAAYARYCDSRQVIDALESALPLQAHQCSEAHLVMILQAVWRWLRLEERQRFHALTLPPECYSAVSSAAAAFYANFPQRPSPLPSPMQSITSGSTATAANTISASPPPTAHPSPSAPGSGSGRKDVALANNTSSATNNNEDDEDADGLLDVDHLTLAEAEALLLPLESDNRRTSLLLQQKATQWMIGAMHLRLPMLLPHVAATHSLEAADDLRAHIAFTRSLLMNQRGARPFSFSLTGTFSRRANDKRRMDLVVTGEEKMVLDRWIQYVQDQEYWKQRVPDDDGPSVGSRSGTGRGYATLPGMPIGKAPSERVDSLYNTVQTASAMAAAAAAEKARLKKQQPPKPKNYLSNQVASSAAIAAAAAAAAAAQSAPPADDEPDVVCCSCGDGDCEDDNQILFCDRCDLAVHQECYGVDVVPEDDWYCAPCSMLISRGFPKQTPTAPQFTCAVCWQKGGAMQRLLIEKKHYKKTLAVLHSGHGKPPAQLTFAHSACASWIGELYFYSIDRMKPICGLHLLNPGRFKLTCTICKVPGGACVQCAEKKCCVAFHVQCALEHGAQLDAINDTSNEVGSRYIAWCEKHRSTPRANVVLKAIDGGQVVGAVPQCQVCCYNVEPQLPPEPETTPNEMLCCTGCNLQCHSWCYGVYPHATPKTQATPMVIEEITNETSSVVTEESKSNAPDYCSTNPPAAAAASGTNGAVTMSDVPAPSSSLVPVLQTSPTTTLASNGMVIRKFLCRMCETTNAAAAAAASAAPGDSKDAKEVDSPQCVLCLATQGALKPTVDGRWVCLPCTYFTPEVFFCDPVALEPICGVPAAFKARGKMKCCICDRTAGCPVQCFNSTCATAYHVSCAYAQGWQFTKNKRDQINCPFISFCGEHSKYATSANGAMDPIFAKATFTDFTLPEETREEGEEDSDLVGELTSTGGGGSGKKKQKPASSSSRKRKHKGGDGDDGDDGGSTTDDSVMVIDSDTEDDAYKHRGTKSRQSAAAASNGGWKMSSGGVGQMTFEKKSKGASAGSTKSSSVANAGSGGAVGKKISLFQRVVFLYDGVMCALAVRDMPGSRSIHVPWTTSTAGEKKRRTAKRKMKTAAAQDMMIKTATGDEDEQSDTEMKASADGDRNGASSTAAAASSSSTGQSDGQAKLKAARRQKRGVDTTERAPTPDVDDTPAVVDEEDDSQLHCICRKPYSPLDALMIGCDTCGGWFHLICFGIKGEEAERIVAQDIWSCPNCEKAKNGPP